MNILVVGGNGFIGSHIIDKFLKENHYVRVIDKKMEIFRKPLIEVDYLINETDSTDDDLLTALDKIDVVVHLQSTLVPSSTTINIIDEINSNVIFTIRLLNSMIAKKVKKIVYFSSGGAIYRNTNIPLKETEMVEPVSLYGIIKVNLEQIINYYSRMNLINSLIIRPSNAYGPRQGNFNKQGVITTFLRKILLKEEIIVFGDGNSKKDYIYINDLIDAVYKLLIFEKTGTYNVGVGDCASINSIIELMTNITNSIPSIKYINEQYYDKTSFVLDINRINNAIRWAPNYNLEEGIKKTWDWIKTINLN